MFRKIKSGTIECREKFDTVQEVKEDEPMTKI